MRDRRKSRFFHILRKSAFWWFRYHVASMSLNTRLFRVNNKKSGESSWGRTKTLLCSVIFGFFLMTWLQEGKQVAVDNYRQIVEPSRILFFQKSDVPCLSRRLSRNIPIIYSHYPSKICSWLHRKTCAIDKQWKDSHLLPWIQMNHPSIELHPGLGENFQRWKRKVPSYNRVLRCEFPHR